MDSITQAGNGLMLAYAFPLFPFLEILGRNTKSLSKYEGNKNVSWFSAIGGERGQRFPVLFTCETSFFKWHGFYDTQSHFLLLGPVAILGFAP